MLRSRQVIVKDVDGNILRRFVSVKEAALAYDISVATMTYWLHSEKDRSGKVFEYADADAKPVKKKETKKKKKAKEPKIAPKVELDREYSNILHYETLGTRVCITPCPYRINPKPTIGSAQCQACSRHNGMDRETHEVACRKIRINI